MSRFARRWRQDAGGTLAGEFVVGASNGTASMMKASGNASARATALPSERAPVLALRD